MGVRERYEQRQKEGKNPEHSGVKHRYMAKGLDDVASNITNRVNTWLKNHNTYISNYQKRNSERKYDYSDSYVSDSADWLSTVSQQKSNFDAEAESILSYMDQYKDYFNAEWMDNVRNTLTGARNTQSQILKNATTDNQWWSNFGTEELVNAYGSAEDAYKYYQRDDGYRKKYSGQKYDDIQKALGVLEDGEEKSWLERNQYEFYKDDTTYNSKAASGYKSYEAQKIAQQEAIKQEEANKTWWDKAADFILAANQAASYGNPITGTIANQRELYAEDKSYMEPNEKWSSEQKNHFGFLYSESPAKAHQYAVQVNNQINATAKYEQQQAVGGWASQNFGTGTLGTLGAITSAPAGITDFMDDLIEYSARGTITQKGYLSPFEMGQAAQSGIANKLNKVDENGVAQSVLPDWVPIVGGKGWGDVYSLGVSAANSLVSAYTMGGVGTLVNFIGQGGASGVDDALSRGATAEQALLYGSIVGAAEGVTEMLSADKLIKVGSSATLKNYLLKALGQGLGETVEEGASSVMGNIADAIIMQDKSNLNAAIKEYMSKGLSKEEATSKAWLDMVGDIAFDALGGFLTGSTNAMTVGGVSTAIDARKGNQKNIDAINQYGDRTDAIIQEGLQNDVKSDSYKLATKYQQQVQGKNGKQGKAMTGAQIRNLLAANQTEVTKADLKKIQNAAANRLAKAGQREDIDKIAELATKYATGQEMTRAERSTLAHSNYGSQVASELLRGEHPDNLLSRWENDMSEESGAEYSTDWTDDIGTESDQFLRYNKKKLVRTILENMANMSAEHPNAYKSLENRMEGETSAKVSDTGKAVIHGTDQEIALDKKVKVTKFVTDKDTGKITDMVLDVDGKEVKASEIDYEDENQSYLFSAVPKIENITPEDATVIIRDYDPASGLSVGEYLNGVDEAFTYGYHGYSEADLKAGDFAPKLSDAQAKSAYVLGQNAKKTGIESQETTYKKMRTAADVQMTAEQKTAQQKARIESNDVEVYFQDGKSVVKFDEHTGKYDAKRKAAVNTAKFLSKLGIGGKYYFFESYVKDNVRVYKDADGNEVEAPNGIYTKDGTIWIDLNAGDSGHGIALFTMGHELTHFIKDKSEKQFKVLCDLVEEAFSKTDLSMHKRVLAKQKFLTDKRGEAVSYTEAYEEVVADAMSTMLTDGNFHEKIMEIKVKDKGLFNTIKRFFEDLIARFMKVYEKLTPDQQDAQDIREMKDMFDRIQTAFAEALVEASENFRASEQVLAQAGIEVNAKTDSGSLQSVRDVLNDAERKKVAKALADRFGVTVEEAREWLKAETSLASLILNPKYSAFLDYEADPNEMAIKQNSDYPQGTVDFSNICKKRREFTQVMNRILRNFPNHVFAATDLAKIRTIMGEEGMTLPCGICYVEDRRQLDTIVAQDFINSLKLYRDGSKIRPDGKPFNANQLKGLQLTDGDSYVPSIYELVSLEGRNSLKAKNPNIEAAWVRFNNARGMQAVRLLTNEAEYKRQILKYTLKTVQTKNDYGGLRIYSFSDAEMFHLIDIVQVLTDCAAVGLKVQGYTKVNEYARAVKDTGEKLNRSLIPLGDLGYHMENGKVVLDYDPVEGIDINSEDFFDSKDNPNVGNIVIGINPTQIRAAMVSDFIDYIIPFHTGQSAEVLGEKGIAAWVNYKDSQSEVDLATGKKSAHQINIYTEVFQTADNEGNPIRNKRDFVEKFLAVCKENGLKPRFAEFLNTDANGDYVYTEGYHKFLVDFKTFAQTEVGEYLPQMPIKPIFDNGYITGLLENYVKEQQVKDAEVAEQMPKVIERITNEIVMQSEGSASRLDRDYLEGKRFSHRDTSAVPQDITAFVDKSLNYRNTNDTMEITIATKWDNSAINKLGRSWSGKYTGSKRVITSEYVRHIINSHGNAFLEALQGQLYMDGDAIKIALSNLRAGKGRVIGGTYSRRGNPTIVTEIPINGYTLYAEEPLENLRGLEIEGRTIYMKPTSTTALKPTQRAGSIPQRRDGLTPSIDATSRIVNNFLADADGKPVELRGVAIQNLPNVGRRTYGTVALSTDVNALNTVYSHISNDTFKVRVKNPYIVDSGHPIIVDEDFYDGNKRRTAAEVIIEKLDMIKAAGYDSIIMDYKSGDNYFVIVFDRNAVEPYVEEDSKTTYRRSERGYGTSNRDLLANAFEGITKSSAEYKQIQKYKSYIAEIESLDKKLQEFNQEIRRIRFTKGAYDAEKLQNLEAETEKIAEAINKYDRYLVSIEASDPIRKLIDRERVKAAKKTKDHVNEIQQNKKIRAEQAEIRHKIKRVVNELNHLLLNGDKKRHVPEKLKKSVADALALVNMDTVGTDERVAKYAALIANETDPDKIDAYQTKMENIQRQGERMGERLEKLRVAYEEISESDDPDIANAYDPVIAGSIKELASSIGDTSLRDMTLEQLQDVYDMYKMVLTRVRDANKSFLSDKKEAISALASRVVGEVKSVGGEHKYRASVLDPAKKFTWDNQKPIYAMERIGSNTLTDAFTELLVGEGLYATDVSHAAKFSDHRKEKYKYDSWDFKKKYKFESASGIEFELTLEQIMSLYAYSKREQAHEHLRLGGFVFDSNIEVSAFTKDGKKLSKLDPRNLVDRILKYKVNTADAHQITPEILADIIGKLSVEQTAFVDEMQKYLSDVMGAKGNEVSMKMYGVKLFKERFYFPLKSAKQFMFEQNEVAGEVKIKNSGFTNKTKPKANNPIILSNFMDVWANHVHDMSMYHAFTLPLEDFNRIFNYNSPKTEGQPPVSVKGTIQSAYSPAATNYIKQLITDLNGGARSDPRESTAKALMGRFKKAAVFASNSVVIQQPSAVLRAQALVDARYFDLNPKLISMSKLWEEAKRYAPVAIIKEMGRFDMDTSRGTVDFIKSDKTFMEKVDDVISWAPAKADEWAWVQLWAAVKKETAAKHRDLQVGSEELLKLAGKRFTEVIVKTQVYDSTLSRSANMRSKGALMSMATAFMAEPTTSINMLENGIRLWKRGNKKAAVRHFSSVYASVLANALLVSIVYAIRDDDEDETFLEKYFGSVSTELIDGINPLTYYPWIKDGWSLLQGFDVERSDMSLLNDVFDALNKYGKLMFTDTEGMTEEQLEKHQKNTKECAWTLVDGVASLLGIPLKNVRRDINSYINLAQMVKNGIVDNPTSFWNEIAEAAKNSIPFLGWAEDASKAEKLYGAITAGDKVYLARLKSTYVDKDGNFDKTKYESAVVKSLRENDPRIHAAAQARYEGNTEEYKRIFLEIKNEGKFSFDDIMSAINSEEAKIRNKVEPDKVTSQYSTGGFVEAVAMGNTSEAQAMKEDIIAAKVANGKTQKEAEKEFASAVSTSIGDAYSSGLLDEARAEEMLTEYAGKDEEEAASKVSYWAFLDAHPEYEQYKLTEANVRKYHEFAEPAGIPMEVFVQFRDRTNGLANIKDEWGDVEKSVRDQTIEVIDSLPLTWQQKDALYLAAELAESRIWDVPW